MKMLQASLRSRSSRFLSRARVWSVAALAGLVGAMSAGLGALVPGCGDGDGDSGGGSSFTEAGPGSPTEAGVVPSDAGVPTATMRLAHLSSDLGPVDFCYRTAKTSSFVGPVLGGGLGVPRRDAGVDPSADGGATDASDDDGGDGGDAASADAGAPSISFLAVTRYLTLEAAGALTLALVEPGAPCSNAIFSADVTLDVGKLATVAILGRRDRDASSESQLSLASYLDDRSTTSSRARVRIIHAALGDDARGAAGPLAARASGAQTVVIAERIEPRKAASVSPAVPVDVLGYATLAPVPPPAVLAVGPAAGSDPDAGVSPFVSEEVDLGLTGGSLHTGFVLTASDPPFSVLWCSDATTSGDRTTCTLVR